MSEEQKDTKLDIIEAAGELFAESGIDAVGIRTIAEKAGVNIAAINYHFGSKENLSVEIFRHIVSCSSKLEIPEIIEKLGDDPSRADLASAIHDVISTLFEPFTGEQHPIWQDRYVIRIMLRPPEAFQAVMKEFFLPEHKALKRLVLLARPDLDDQRAMALALSLNAHTAFYFLAREPLAMMLGDRFDCDYFKIVVEEVTQACLKALNLEEIE